MTVPDPEDYGIDLEELMAEVSESFSSEMTEDLVEAFYQGPEEFYRTLKSYGGIVEVVDGRYTCCCPVSRRKAVCGIREIPDPDDEGSVKACFNMWHESKRGDFWLGRKPPEGYPLKDCPYSPHRLSGGESDDVESNL